MVRTNVNFGKYPYLANAKPESKKEIDEKLKKELDESLKEELTTRIIQLLDIINSSKMNWDTVEACVELSTLVPNNFTADISRARAYANLKEIDKAEELFKKIIEKTNKKSTMAYFYYALFLSDIGKHQESMKCYDRVLSIDENHVGALSNKGLALGRRGDTQEAMKYFDRILSIDKNNLLALSNKGIALDRRGDNQEAMKYFDKILSIDKNNVPALNNKGIAHGENGEYQEAMKCFKKVLSIKDSDETRKAIEYYIEKQNQPQKENTTNELEDINQDEDKKPRWLNDPATEKQLQYIEKLGGDRNAPKTKGEASEMITKLQSQKK